MAEDDDLAVRATAYHESGHAVAQWWQDLPIEQVTIVPSGDALGSCTSDYPDWFRDGHALTTATDQPTLGNMRDSPADTNGLGFGDGNTTLYFNIIWPSL